MSSVGKAFDTALESLREKYVARLSGTVVELNQFAVLCEFDETTTDMLAAIGRLAHKLSGSGETLGFPQISKSAAALEDILGTAPQSLEDIAALARALARACEAATQLPGNDTGAPATIVEGTEGTDVIRPDMPAFLAFYVDPAVERVVTDVFSSKATITRCATLAALIDGIRAGGASLLLVDLDHPECPREAIATIGRTADESRIPIVAFTAQRRTAAVASAVGDGRIDCLLKPLDTVVLYRKAIQAIERQRRIAVLCDDDPVVRELLKQRFEADGFEVHLANDGEEAIERARRVHPSVIVLDRSMPKVEGLSALKILKAETGTQDIPVVMLTSKAQPHEVTEGLRNGAAAYMIKPFAPATVVAKCLELLGAPPPRRD